MADLSRGSPACRCGRAAGLGAFTSRVLCAAPTPNEVAIFLDGVPLSRAASGAVDLSQLPVDGLDHVEIYRGVPPIELGAEAIGGAITW